MLGHTLPFSFGTRGERAEGGMEGLVHGNVAGSVGTSVPSGKVSRCRYSELKPGLHDSQARCTRDSKALPPSSTYTKWPPGSAACFFDLGKNDSRMALEDVGLGRETLTAARPRLRCSENIRSI